MAQQRKGKFLYEERKHHVRPGDFTLVLGFSRVWCVEPIIESLCAMKIPLSRCHLLVYDNTDKGLLEQALMENFMLFKGVFASMRIYKSYRKGGSVIVGMKDYRWEDTKLVPVNAMYKDFKWIIETDVFINIEDDTYCPPNTVEQLLRDLERYKGRAFITGLETSRSADRDTVVLLGAYYIRGENGRIVQKCSLDPRCHPRSTACVRVDACGWYCFATTKSVWLQGFKGHPVRAEYVHHFASDVFHTWNIHNAGIPVIADYKIRCFHMQPDPKGIIYWKVCQAVPHLDYYIKEHDVWAIMIPLKHEIRL